MVKDRGKLIVLEGISGAGKSTVLRRIKEILKSKEYNIVVAGGYKRGSDNIKTGHPIEELLEDLIKRNPFIRLPWFSETYLLMSYLTLHVEEIIKPAIMGGKIIFYEHYVDSIKAYQLARALEENVYSEALSFFDTSLFTPNIRDGIIKPTISIFLDVAPKIAIKRFEIREKCMLGKSDKKFIKNTYNQYQGIIKKKDYITISNDKDIAYCVKEIINIIKLDKKE